MVSQKTLLSEQTISGSGDLFWGAAYLGKCHYRLKVRSSRLKIVKNRPDGGQEAINFLITTIIGTMIAQGLTNGPNEGTSAGFFLHISDDYLVPLCVYRTPLHHMFYQLLGRVVIESPEGAIVSEKKH